MEIVAAIILTLVAVVFFTMLCNLDLVPFAILGMLSYIWFAVQIIMFICKTIKPV